MLARARDLLICAGMVVVILYATWSWSEQNLVAKLRLEQRAVLAEQKAATCK